MSPAPRRELRTRRIILTSVCARAALGMQRTLSSLLGAGHDMADASVVCLICAAPARSPNPDRVTRRHAQLHRDLRSHSHHVLRGTRAALSRLCACM